MGLEVKAKSGVVCGLISCSCALIPLAFVLTGSVALFRAFGLGHVIGPLETPIIILSGLLLFGAVIVGLKRENCCNLKGLKERKTTIAVNLAVYGAFVVLFFLYLKPYVMSRLGH